MSSNLAECTNIPQIDLKNISPPTLLYSPELFLNSSSYYKKISPKVVLEAIKYSENNHEIPEFKSVKTFMSPREDVVYLQKGDFIRLAQAYKNASEFQGYFRSTPSNSPTRISHKTLAVTTSLNATLS
ncbi:MAG: hypothetical protein V4694_02430 [Pseudomonadota bacterium]